MLFYAVNYLKSSVRDFVGNEDGMGVIEVAVIIVILIGLAVVFKGKVEGVLNSIMDAMSVEEITG